MDFINFIPSFGGLLFTIAAFVVALLIIIAVHEFGHYIVGRWTGIKADVFSLGFGPVLWSRHDKHGTKWQLAALPFGGFVKFRGDANAASGADYDAMAEMAEADKRSTMFGAPLWARAATVAAGPLFNFILSILIFAALTGYRGVATDPLSVAELKPVPTEQGLMVGDEVLEIAGILTPSVDDLSPFLGELPAEGTLSYLVRRDGQEVEVFGPHPLSAIVGSVNPGSAAIEAGLESGDVIVTVNDQQIELFNELPELVEQSAGNALDLSVWRNGQTLDITLQPKRTDLPLPDGGFETRWLIGIGNSLVFTPGTRAPGVGEALKDGYDSTWNVITTSISVLREVAVGGIDSCNIRGPIGIAQTSGQVASQGWFSFISFIALLSTAVGFLNLLPIPVLDGGHLVFHTYEAIRGKPPSERAMQIFMTIGLAMLLTLMVFALSNDLTCP